MANLWADSPLELISVTGIENRPEIPKEHTALMLARIMAQLHNIIFRGFNSSYNQCLGVKAGTPEARDFLIYNQVLFETIESHHYSEETYVFPELQKFTGEKDLMAENVAQHREFDDGLHRLKDYAYGTDAKDYDGEKFKEILDNLGPVLAKHLRAEISTLLDLAKYDSAGLYKLWLDVDRKAVAHLDKTRSGIFIASCIDSTYAVDSDTKQFPQIPTLVLYLARYVLSRPLRGVWRFSPCDYFGTPRPLAFPNPTTTNGA